MHLEGQDRKSWWMNKEKPNNVNKKNRKRNWVLATNSDLLFLYFCNPILYRPFIFQTMNSVRSNCLSLKYQRFVPSGCKDIGIRNFIKALEKGIHLIKKQDFEKRWKVVSEKKVGLNNRIYVLTKELSGPVFNANWS